MDYPLGVHVPVPPLSSDPAAPEAELCVFDFGEHLVMLTFRAILPESFAQVTLDPLRALR
ncbi:MAG: hypothetical protein ACLQPH_11815 [Acidimicrobiales bacterium]